MQDGEKEEEVKRGSRGIQRTTKGREQSEGEVLIRTRIKAIREGHETGGYVESIALQREEKKLGAILATAIEERIPKHDRESEEQVQEAKRELRGFSHTN